MDGNQKNTQKEQNNITQNANRKHWFIYIEDKSIEFIFYSHTVENKKNWFVGNDWIQKRCRASRETLRRILKLTLLFILYIIIEKETLQYTVSAIKIFETILRL